MIVALSMPPRMARCSVTPVRMSPVRPISTPCSCSTISPTASRYFTSSVPPETSTAPLGVRTIQSWVF